MLIKVSVIVPIYNSEKYLRTCLNSIIHQTLKEIEIILVDDGSTDNSSEIYNEYLKNDNRIIVIKQTNQKQGAARNRGIEIAKGKYIGFVDADDYIDLNFFEELYNTAEKYDSDMAIASLIKVSNQKQKYKWKFKTKQVLINDYDKFITGYQIKNAAPYNKIYRKSFIEKNKIRFKENVFYEDGPFSIKAIHFANKIITVPGISYYYIKNPTSTVNSKQTEKHLNDALNAKKEILDFVRKHNFKLPQNAFHYTKKIYKIFHLPILSIKENVNQEIFYLFKFIPIFSRKI